MRVREIMSAPPVTVTRETGLKQVAKLLAEHRISGVPVVDGDRVIGVVSASDVVGTEQQYEGDEPTPWWRLRLRAAPRPERRTAGQAMTAPAVTVESFASAVGAAWLMTQHDVARLPVVEHGRLVGIVTRSDLVRAFARSDEEIHREIVGEVLPALGLSAVDVDVTVGDGLVRLRGEVEDELDARCLPHAVRAVVGVLEVDSEVTGRNSHTADRASSRF